MLASLPAVWRVTFIRPKGQGLYLKMNSPYAYANTFLGGYCRQYLDAFGGKTLTSLFSPPEICKTRSKIELLFLVAKSVQILDKVK